MSGDAITVRSLGFSDLPQVMGIERRSFPTPWSLAMFVLELSKPRSICLAATGPDGRLVGYLVCSRYDQAWHVMNVAVDPTARSGGVATLMFERLLERAGPNSSFTLEVRTSNAPAIALYERFGFRAAGTRKRYYQDTGEDALVMWRTPLPLSERGVPEP